MPPNVEFPLDVVVGPILACVTDEDGDDRGMPLEQAEAVARALDHYAVGPKKANYGSAFGDYDPERTPT